MYYKVQFLAFMEQESNHPFRNQGVIGDIERARGMGKRVQNEKASRPDKLCVEKMLIGVLLSIQRTPTITQLTHVLCFF